MAKRRDMTPVLEKVFRLRDDMLELRAAFPVAGNDERAEKDRQFIRKWRKIEASGHA